jgi:hypothetical protein
MIVVVSCTAMRLQSRGSVAMPGGCDPAHSAALRSASFLSQNRPHFRLGHE